MGEEFRMNQDSPNNDNDNNDRYTRMVRGITVCLVQGDISVQEAGALVNAANSRLAGGGGVDGAIHRRGGPAIMEETNRRYPNGCPTGQAVESGAGRLSACHVIHAVAPRYSARRPDNAKLLLSAYGNSLRVAEECGCRSVALPSLGTGAYAYPLRDASRIAMRAVRDFAESSPEAVSEIRFVLFDSETLAAFATAMAEELGQSGEEERKQAGR